MTPYKQIENYPTGDCVRSCMASILDVPNLQEVPNFMRDGAEYFVEYFTEWLDSEGLVYLEYTLTDFFNSPWVPEGFCLLSGKSPRGEWDHMVVGEHFISEQAGGMMRNLRFIHDTSPLHDGTYIDGEVKEVGFLFRKLEGGR